MMNLKKTARTAAVLLLVIALLLPFALNTAAADYYMAYNFYSNPDLSGTSGKFDSFMIDFRAPSGYTPKSTYWSLCNFSMDLSSQRTREAYPDIRGYGAYAGLQNTTSAKGRTGILSFWEANYKAEGAVYTQQSDGSWAYTLNGEKVLVRASRVYPGGEGSFTGEGEGTNIIENYPWQDDHWYTMLLHAWEDEDTGTTFVGIWYKDISADEWLLFSYFDTHLYDSFFVGAMSQFQENYSRYSYNYRYERRCNLKNTYVYDHTQSTWKSLSRSTLSYGDGGAANKAGAHSFGKDSDEGGEFFWASTGGTVEDQAAYEASSVKSKAYTISQPAQPAFDDVCTPTVTVTDEEDGRFVTWELPASSAPTVGYTVNVYDIAGNLLFTEHRTRPDVRRVDISSVEEKTVRCEVLLDGVFEKDVTSSYGESPEYVSAFENFTFLPAAPDVHGSSTVNVNVSMIDPPCKIYGYSLELAYDPAQVAFKGIVQDARFPYARYTVNEEEGYVRFFGATEYKKPVSDSCNIADLEFALLDGSSEHELTFELRFFNSQPAYTLNSSGKTVNLNANAGSVTVHTDAFGRYDLNLDGSVSILDVSALLDHVSGHAGALPEGVDPDLDGSGTVDISDVSTLLDVLSNAAH